MLLDEHRVDEARIAAAVADADARFPLRHRARSDALWLYAVLDHALADAGPAHGPLLLHAAE